MTPNAKRQTPNAKRQTPNAKRSARIPKPLANHCFGLSVTGSEGATQSKMRHYADTQPRIRSAQIPTRPLPNDRCIRPESRRRMEDILNHRVAGDDNRTGVAS